MTNIHHSHTGRNFHSTVSMTSWSSTAVSITNIAISNCRKTSVPVALPGMSWTSGTLRTLLSGTSEKGGDKRTASNDQTTSTKTQRRTWWHAQNRAQSSSTERTAASARTQSLHPHVNFPTSTAQETPFDSHTGCFLANGSMNYNPLSQKPMSTLKRNPRYERRALEDVERV
jgi:hypothetical protein